MVCSHLNRSRSTREEYFLRFQLVLKLITMLKYLAGAKRVENRIGWEEIHGAHLGESLDFSESKWDPITLESKPIAILAIL